MAFPDGLWLSFVKMVPGPFPNDGVVIINPLDASNDFDGYHHRPPDTTPIEGHFTPASGGRPDHITFTETYNSVTYEYDADIIQFTPNFFVTTNGKRTPVSPGSATTDDWVGTHTT